MRGLAIGSRLLLVSLILAAAAIATGCGGNDGTSATTITASVLVEPSDDDARWFRDVAVPEGTDGYELLEEAVDGELEAEWYPEFRSHFVSTILEEAPEGSEFWGVFLWNESTGAWEPLPFGADLLSVKDGLVVGWALVEYDPNNPQVPASTP